MIVGFLGSSMIIANQNVNLNTLSYRFTGSISENGNEYWEGSEYDFYTYRVYENELFEVELSLSRAEDVYILFFSGDSVEDIDDAMYDIVYYGSSYMVYSADVATNGYAKISYDAPRDTIGRIAIFSYSIYSYSSVSYTMRSSIPQGSSRNNRGLDYVNTNTQTSSDDNDSASGIIILFVIILAVFLIIRSRNKKKQETYGQYRYPQYSQNTISDQNSHQSQSIYGSNFYPDSPKSQGYDRFCTNCGGGIRLNQIFCNSCGSK